MLANLFASLGMKIAGGLALGAFLALAVVMWRADAISAQRDAYRASLALADARIVLLEADAALKEASAIERTKDTAATAAMEKELVNEIRNIPDTQPDAVRVRLGCERLRRRAGGVGADFPAVCGPAGGSQAGPRP